MPSLVLEVWKWYTNYTSNIHGGVQTVKGEPSGTGTGNHKAKYVSTESRATAWEELRVPHPEDTGVERRRGEEEKCNNGSAGGWAGQA